MASSEQISKVKTYTEPVGLWAGSTQHEYKGMLVVTKGEEVVFGGFDVAVKKSVAESIWEIKEEAVKVGANAVVGIKIETNYVNHKYGDKEFLVTVYGTAV